MHESPLDHYLPPSECVGPVTDFERHRRWDEDQQLKSSGCTYDPTYMPQFDWDAYEKVCCEKFSDEDRKLRESVFVKDMRGIWAAFNNGSSVIYITNLIKAAAMAYSISDLSRARKDGEQCTQS